MNLSELRKEIYASLPSSHTKICEGLSDEDIERFLKLSPDLAKAIDLAAAAWSPLSTEIKSKDPKTLLNFLQANILNFYPDDSRAPYVPLAGKGPWVITTEGSVIYESGGYGMLGFGHSPDFILKEIAKEEVMANVMTASIAQKKASDALRQSIGMSRKEGCPFSSFAFLNSGSEANNLAMRLAELYASKLKGGNGPTGKKTTVLTLKKGFHGRTDAPARVSDSSMKSYKDLPMLGKQLDDVIKVEMNDISGLRAAFEQAASNKIFICAAIVEPVMGEGNAGLAMSKEFYGELRRLTKENNTVLIIDSIQAGMRAHGVLSIVDYEEMKGLEAPDIETFSKAINGGQFPISVAALQKHIADTSNAGPGVYGNTMTTNPKAMNIVAATLNAMTPQVKKNIVDKGRYFLERLNTLVKDLPAIAESAQGTGLLLSLKLNPSKPVEGLNGVEIKMRKAGVNVIHSAGNSLRFTPHFSVTKEEVDLIISVLTASLN